MFFVNIVYYVVHIVCEVDVIANSLVLYLPFCSTLNKNFFSLLLLSLLTRRASMTASNGEGFRNEFSLNTLVWHTTTCFYTHLRQG